MHGVSVVPSLRRHLQFGGTGQDSSDHLHAKACMRASPGRGGLGSIIAKLMGLSWSPDRSRLTRCPFPRLNQRGRCCRALNTAISQGRGLIGHQDSRGHALDTEYDDHEREGGEEHVAHELCEHMWPAGDTPFGLPEIPVRPVFSARNLLFGLFFQLE